MPTSKVEFKLIIGANQPTPWVGVTERINIGVFILWVVVLAMTLLRARKEDDPE